MAETHKGQAQICDQIPGQSSQSSGGRVRFRGLLQPVANTQRGCAVCGELGLSWREKGVLQAFRLCQAWMEKCSFLGDFLCHFHSCLLAVLHGGQEAIPVG